MKKLMEVFFAFGGGIISICVLGVILTVILILNVPVPNGTESEIIEREIVTMNAGDYITGSYDASAFLLSGSAEGSISEDGYYKLFAKTDDGGYEMLKIPENEVIIYEDDSTTPHLVKTSTFERVEEKRWGKVVGTHHGEKIEDKYQIYVPEGTVKVEYSVN